MASALASFRSLLRDLFIFRELQTVPIFRFLGSCPTSSALVTFWSAKQVESSRASSFQLHIIDTAYQSVVKGRFVGNSTVKLHTLVLKEFNSAIHLFVSAGFASTNRSLFEPFPKDLIYAPRSILLRNKLYTSNPKSGFLSTKELDFFSRFVSEVPWRPFLNWAVPNRRWFESFYLYGFR